MNVLDVLVVTGRTVVLERPTTEESLYQSINRCCIRMYLCYVGLWGLDRLKRMKVFSHSRCDIATLKAMAFSLDTKEAKIFNSMNDGDLESLLINLEAS